MKRTMLIITLCGLLPWAGCSALHWGGEAAGENPGIHVRGGSLLERPEISVTANGTAKADRVEYVRDTSGGQRFTLDGLDYQQDASAVMREEPTKLKAIADVQRVQVEYVQATWAGIVGVVHEIAPALSALAAAKCAVTDSGLTLTLPSGLTVGKRTLNTPQDVSAYFTALTRTVQAVEVAAPAMPAAAAPAPAEPAAVVPDHAQPGRNAPLASEASASATTVIVAPDPNVAVPPDPQAP
jgi:hypothetical protein